MNTVLKAADFEREILSASLTYLTGNDEVRVVILENQAYRFMVMQGTIQSVMSLAQPEQLLFAHQQVMLQNLAQLHPGARVLELGLGGGSAVRHARLHNFDLHWTSVEHNSEVVSLFWDYFSPLSQHHPERLDHVIELAESRAYVSALAAQQQFELILCDVYDELGYELLRLCVNHLSAKGELVVNWLPHLQPQGAQSDEFFATLASQMKLNHSVTGIPGFANQIHRLRQRSS